jgi:hypothetical protein
MRRDHQPEGNRQDEPERAPAERLPEMNFVRLSVKDPEVNRQCHQNR